MANHKSALKRARQSLERRTRNRSRKTHMKNVIKKLGDTLSSGTEEALLLQLKETIAVIDKTAGKGVIHKNKASRKISRLTRKVNAHIASKSA